MPKITEIQCGLVFLREVEPRKWRASWWDSISRKHIRRILPASNYQDAKEQADAINSELAAKKGFSGRLRGAIGHKVDEAVKEAIQHTDASERTRKDYGSAFNAFTDYINTHCKGVTTWKDVTEPILANYLEYCRKQDVSFDTLRMRLFVLRLTSAYMSKTYPGQYRDVAASIRLKRHDPPKAELEAKDAILSPKQLRALLVWLKDNEPMVYVWAMLQGLCGLRMQEAAYLREQDFDPEAGTITITETSAHKPKNKPSYRCIPAAPAVTDALAGWVAGMKVRHAEGYLFHPERALAGEREAKTREARAGAYTRDTVGKFWGDAVVKAKVAGIEFSSCFVPRKLRATFVTALREADADLAILQHYIGHAASTILDEHYDKKDGARLARITQLAQQLFEGSGAFEEKAEKGGKKGAVLQQYCIEERKSNIISA